MYPRILGIVVAIAMTSTVVGAAPFPVIESRADETRSQIAYDDVHDRYLVVWDTGTGVAGRLMESSGGAIGQPFPIFWDYGPDTYETPAVAFKTHLNRHYVVALRTSTATGTTDIVLRVFEADGQLVGSLPQQIYSGRWGRNIPAHLTIVADSYATHCCILVSWSDDVTGNIDGMLIDETGVAPWGRVAIANGSASRSRFVAPSAAYSREWDEYFLTYEQDPDSGNSVVVARTVAGFGTWVGSEVFRHTLSTVDSSREGAPPPDARPRVAYNTHIGVFLVSWFDRTPARVQAQLFGLDGPKTFPYRPTFTIAAGSPLESPTVVATGEATHFAAYLHERWDTDAARTVSLQIADGFDSVSVTRAEISSSFATRRGHAAAAYAHARGTVLVTWDEFTHAFTYLNDIWGALHTP